MGTIGSSNTYCHSAATQYSSVGLQPHQEGLPSCYVLTQTPSMRHEIDCNTRRTKHSKIIALVITLSCPSWLDAQDLKSAEIDAEPIAAAQHKTNWCWAAGCEMLAKSQGVDLPQEWF